MSSYSCPLLRASEEASTILKVLDSWPSQGAKLGSARPCTISPMVINLQSLSHYLDVPHNAFLLIS